MYAFVRRYIDENGEDRIELIDPNHFPLTEDEKNETLKQMRERGYVQMMRSGSILRCLLALIWVRRKRGKR